MAGWFILIAIGAVVANSGSGVFGWAISNAVASFWSNGVLLNFRGDPVNAPDWAATVSMITLAASVILLVVGVIN